MNPDVKETFIKRSQILREINYLDSLGFMEVETPVLVENAGEQQLLHSHSS